MRTLLLAAVLATALTAGARPLVPASDDQVLQRLPARAVPRAAARDASLTPAQAADRARRLMAQARAEGDPRFAGQAIALLRPWSAQPEAPPDVVVALADAEQHLHEFDAARARLQALVQRAPAHAQAWLMLATLHRVQGRLPDSEAACARLLALRVQPHADACAAENAAWRGRTDEARQRLARWLADPRAAGAHAWLAATLGDAEAMAGRDRAAEAAYRRSLARGRDVHTAVALADLLLRLDRHREVRPLLAGLPATDAVLVRIALADPRDDAGRDAARTLAERFAQADARGAAGAAHARERALAALHLQRDAAEALRWAEANVQRQREPVDLALWLACATAAGDAGAARRAHAAIDAMGLVDARLAPPSVLP